MINYDAIGKGFAEILRAMTGGVVGRIVIFLMVAAISIAFICYGTKNPWVSGGGITAIVVLALVLGLRVLKMVEKNAASAILESREWLDFQAVAAKNSVVVSTIPVDAVVKALPSVEARSEANIPDAEVEDEHV